LKKQIKELDLEDKVLLKGHVDNAIDYMYHADLFVLSSLWEGFGNVIVEALSVGCPVVSMNCPSGPAEILEDGKWGSLVEKRDPKILADVIVAELRNKKAVKKNLQRRANDFIPKKIAKQYLKFID
jgi:glycosyltransferase involved in cell wall biosynthesis